MDIYTVSQWLFFFYLYCFIGWVWESCYVSVRKGKWVNRGFMHGPFLPIYGSGAMVVLISTIPVRDSIPLIYIVGMVCATILEYCTGACMEKLFGVRYWDYSNKPLNLNGHICLGVSLGWGVFSVLMVKVVHIPIANLVLMIPDTIIQICSFILTGVVAVDFTISFMEAMDLKATLTKLAESNDKIRMLEKRIEVVSAFASDSYRQYKEAQEEKKESLAGRYLANLNAKRIAKSEWLTKLEESAKTYFASHVIEKSEQNQILTQIRTELEKMHMRTDREYANLRKILKRNPDAISMEHKGELDEIKEMMELKKKGKNTR